MRTFETGATRDSDDTKPDYAGSIAWAAGLFEGEGCVYLHQGKPTLQVRMTDEDVLRRFRDAVGIGRVYGPYVTRQSRDGQVITNPKWKPNWSWQVRGADAICVMALLAPLMCARRSAKITEVFYASV